MSEFYRSIEKHYEDIFVPSKNQVEFLKSMAKGKDVLDIACGTGAVAQEMAKAGYNVVAIDLEESMIERAKKKQGIQAMVGNMLELDKIEGQFDLVYCIGNSIAHLDGLDEIETFFKESYKKVKEGGSLVVQWINFEKFLMVKDEYLGELPTIENNRIKFVRKYYRESKKVRFNTVLTVEGKDLENDQLLYPLLVDDAKKLVTKVGYKDVEIYGGFDKSSYMMEKSTPIVMVARK